MPKTDDLFPPGSIIASRYQVKGVLGSGGMGWVLLASDRQLGGIEVALKLLYPHLLSWGTSFARFRTEVALTRRLSCSSIVQTYGFGRDEQGLPFVAMEYVPGRTLKQLISEHPGGLPFSTIERVAAQTVSALRHAHGKGIIHRDVKPENILVTSELAVKVVDFGLAQFVREESRFTKSGQIVGTPYYMSPEQVLGLPLSEASDIYSFGILCHEMASGSPPFTGGSLAAVAEQHLRDPLAPLLRNDLPEWYHLFVRHCTEKNPELRFSSAEQAAQFLNEHLSENTRELLVQTGAAPLPVQRANSAAFFLRRHGGAVLAGAAAAILLALNTGFSYGNASVREFWALPIFRLERATGLNMVPLKFLTAVNGRYGDNSFLFTARSPEEILPLIRAGMNANVVNPETGQTLLFRFMDLNMAGRRYHETKDLLQLKVAPKPDPDILNSFGESALHWAVRTRNLDAIRLLLECGADADFPDPDGATPLTAAVKRNDVDMLLALLARANPNFGCRDASARSSKRPPECKSNLPPLFYAAKFGRLRITRALLRAGRLPIAGSAMRTCG